MSLFVIITRRSFSTLKQVKEKLLPNEIKFDIDMKNKLERLSLISFQNEQTIKKVEQTIQSTNIIHQANVNHLEPLYTLVENEMCPLRQTDLILNEKTLEKQQVLQNASKTYEEYFVAPIIGKRQSQTVEIIDKNQL